MVNLFGEQFGGFYIHFKCTIAFNPRFDFWVFILM